MRPLPTLVIAMIVAAAPAARATRVADEAPRIEAQLESDTICLGEPVGYIVQVLNADSAPEPQLAGLEPFTVERFPPSSLNSSSIMVVNGRMTRTSTRGTKWVYRLTPKTAGDFDLPGPHVTVDGKEIVGPTTTLHVLAPQPSPLADFDAAVERHGKFPMQPFVVTLRVFERKLPPPYQSRDPLGPTDPPRLRVPWGDVPDGLAAESDDDWLEPLAARNDDFNGRGPTGFTINNRTLRDAGPFGLFAGGRLEVFDLGGRAAQESDVVTNERLRGHASEYFVYELRRRFTPLRPGKFRFAESCLQGELVADVQERRPVGEHVFACGGAIEVEVAEVPSKGRPAGYSGAVGRAFRLSAEVAPRRVRVGDPMTLTMTLSGSGNLSQVQPPHLAELANVAADFQVDEPTVESTESSRVFTWSVRPRRQDVQRFPPIEFSWFDVDQESFQAVATRELPIHVDAIESLAPGSIVKGANTGSAKAADVARAAGLFGNDTDAGLVRDQRPDLRLVFGVPLALLAAFVVIRAAVGIRRRRALDPAAVRRRGAARRARERLDQLAVLPPTDALRRAEAAHAVVAGLVADAAGVSEAGLAARDVASGLAALGVTQDGIARAVRLLDRCDQLRFGAPDAGGDLADEARAVVESTIAELKRAGRIS